MKLVGSFVSAWWKEKTDSWHLSSDTPVVWALDVTRKPFLNCYVVIIEVQWGLLLSKIVDSSSSPIHPRTRKSSQLGESFMVSTNLISWCPITIVFSIFCNRVLQSSSGKQWRGMQISYIVLEDFFQNISWRTAWEVLHTWNYDVNLPILGSSLSLIACIG